ncbi:hypothetical protein RMSM_01279 [Rhodopirellula maiorica SM1]|uniref:Uncharacterized protein n=1 Tax=Rhodopirellula maiorica SM1 TaxID=1265738 RepID=M5RR56_9BACT|nr:hypothetical protein RMSM_01279 [Rhodopirellula maiorica SM1]
MSSVFENAQGVYYAANAVDGLVADNSRWLADPSSTQPNTIEAKLVSPHRVGSLHVYSGFQNGSSVSDPLADFNVEFYDGTDWISAPISSVSSGTATGNSVTGNTSAELVVNFSEVVAIENVRLTFDQNYGRIRELVVLPRTNSNESEAGFPLGTSVQRAAKPDTQFAEFGDAWFRIAARGSSDVLVASEAGVTQTDSGNLLLQESRFQLLYSYALDAYRIRNRVSGRALEVENASLLSGAAIVEGEYSAAPHQLWRLETTDSGYYQLINVWSGMAIQTSGGSSAELTQQSVDTSTNPINQQEWKPFFRDDYFKKGTGGWVGSYGTGWAYNWNRSDPDLPVDQFYVPMQHRAGWPDFSTLHTKYGDWHRDVKPSYFLGFNEPDRPEQANMTVERALELWPRLENLDLPLISPVPATINASNTWLATFMDDADQLGYRTDYGAAHWYAGPNVGSVFNRVDAAQDASNGRDVWLTEFSVVDWSGGSGNWTEEDIQSFILEFL